MKNIAAFAMAILMASCNNPGTGHEKDGALSSLENFDWLVGEWQRTNEKVGRETIEMWRKETDSQYLGFGATIQDGDTVWYEHIKLVESNNLWSFEVTGKGDTTATVFMLTKIEKGKFTSENDQNEFPKKIEYHIMGNTLKALISGGDMEIPFDFKRVNPK